MRDLQLQLFQLNEACRYFRDGRLPHLRLSLLLLDNSVELQIDKLLRHEFMYEELRESIRKHALRVPKEKRTPDLIKLAAWKPLSLEAKNKAIRFFNDKIDLLVQRYSLIDPAIAEVIKYLHKYRNDAYHNARLRRETIATSVFIYIDLVSELLLKLKSTGMSFSSGEDYSWLENRFGIKAISAFHEKSWLSRAVDNIREAVSITDDSIKSTLVKNLESRLVQILKDLEFVITGTGVANLDEALLECYKFSKNHPETGERKFKSSRSIFKMTFIYDIRERLQDIGLAQDRLSAFAAFAHLEAKLEPIEESVGKVVSVIDQEIQRQTDIARGK